MSATESYRIIIFDTSEIPEKVKLEIKKYEIWIGWYHLGQGYHPPSEPQKLAEVEASSFKIACYLYELQSAADSLKERMKKGDNYIEGIHFGRLDYDPKTNSNSWTGRYFETKEEAQKTFKKYE